MVDIGVMGPETRPHPNEWMLKDPRLPPVDFIEKIMMNMPLTVFMISDLAGYISYSSPNVKSIYGWTQTEVVGMWGWKRVHPDDIRRIKRNIPLPANAIYRVYKKNGEYVTVNCQYNRIGDYYYFWETNVEHLSQDVNTGKANLRYLSLISKIMYDMQTPLAAIQHALKHTTGGRKRKRNDLEKTLEFTDIAMRSIISQINQAYSFCQTALSLQVDYQKSQESKILQHKPKTIMAARAFENPVVARALSKAEQAIVIRGQPIGRPPQIKGRVMSKGRTVRSNYGARLVKSGIEKRVKTERNAAGIHGDHRGNITVGGTHSPEHQNPSKARRSRKGSAAASSSSFSGAMSRIPVPQIRYIDQELAERQQFSTKRSTTRNFALIDGKRPGGHYGQSDGGDLSSIDPTIKLPMFGELVHSGKEDKKVTDDTGLNSSRSSDPTPQRNSDEIWPSMHIEDEEPSGGALLAIGDLGDTVFNPNDFLDV